MVFECLDQFWKNSTKVQPFLLKIPKKEDKTFWFFRIGVSLESIITVIELGCGLIRRLIEIETYISLRFRHYI